MDEPQTIAPAVPAGAIVRPDEPRHFMVLEPVEGTVRARVGDTVIASSSRALRVVESFGREQPPVIYFPPQDVRSELLAPRDETTRCPLKGTAAAFDLDLRPRLADAAWSYQQTRDFDRRLTQLECCVAFDTQRVTVEVTEEQ